MFGQWLSVSLSLCKIEDRLYRQVHPYIPPVLGRESPAPSYWTASHFPKCCSSIRTVVTDITHTVEWTHFTCRVTSWEASKNFIPLHGLLITAKPFHGWRTIQCTCGARVRDFQHPVWKVWDLHMLRCTLPRPRCQPGDQVPGGHHTLPNCLDGCSTPFGSHWIPFSLGYGHGGQFPRSQYT